MRPCAQRVLAEELDAAIADEVVREVEHAQPVEVAPRAGGGEDARPNALRRLRWGVTRREFVGTVLCRRQGCRLAAYSANVLARSSVVMEWR